MDTARARELYEQYAASMAYVEVRRPDGSVNIGSAFHVGDGVYVTARHVCESNQVLEVASTESAYQPLPPNPELPFLNEFNLRQAIHHPGKGKIVKGPIYHRDPRVDVAAFCVEGISAPPVPLGGHLDDWLGTELVLTSAVVMGYPPIPLSRGPLLVAAKAEINAIVDKYSGPHPHFILSAMSRGGYSGGLALSEYGFALGVVTESLVTSQWPPELGYFAVISVEPIFTCLADHKMLPAVQKEGWDDHFWDTKSTYFWPPGTSGGGPTAASIEAWHDRGEGQVTIACDDEASLNAALAAAVSATPCQTIAHIIRPGQVQLQFPAAAGMVREAHVELARKAAVDTLRHAGYVMMFPEHEPE